MMGCDDYLTNGPVTPEQIAAQRAAGWPDFHPEDFCHRCGRTNIVWWVDSDLFNEAIGPEGIDPEWRGIVCPQCFVDLSPLDTVWRLVPRERDFSDGPSSSGLSDSAVHVPRRVDGAPSAAGAPSKNEQEQA